MNLADLRAQLDANQAWRRDELRHLQNYAAQLPNEDEEAGLLRPLVLLLYAHFEGYCKFALVLYVDTINAAKIKCGEANFVIAAAALDDIFELLRNSGKLSSIFRNILPDDSQLHTLARSHEFLERLSEFESFTVNISDKYISMQSNLTPSVLQKNLYKLGLPHSLFSSYEPKINMLLNYRNKIAHGEHQTLSKAEYERLRQATFDIMDGVTLQIYKALQEKWYLRANSSGSS